VKKTVIIGFAILAMALVLTIPFALVANSESSKKEEIQGCKST
jgi:ABC-type phosphate/phosphonate transport system permease subunit